MEPIDRVSKSAVIAWLCCKTPGRDSSLDSSAVAGTHVQADIPGLQDQELASLQSSTPATWIADDPVRPRHGAKSGADREARAKVECQGRCDPDVFNHEGEILAALSSARRGDRCTRAR